MFSWMRKIFQINTLQRGGKREAINGLGVFLRVLRGLSMAIPTIYICTYLSLRGSVGLV